MKIMNIFKRKSRLERQVEEVIGVGRKERLLKHFTILEERTQTPCKRRKRYGYSNCPIANYMPSIIKVDGKRYRGGSCNQYGDIWWRTWDGWDDYRFKLYTKNDSKWWDKLLYSSKRLVNTWLEEYFKAKYK